MPKPAFNPKRSGLLLPERPAPAKRRGFFTMKDKAMAKVKWYTSADPKKPQVIFYDEPAEKNGRGFEQLFQEFVTAEIRVQTALTELSHPVAGFFERNGIPINTSAIDADRSLASRDNISQEIIERYLDLAIRHWTRSEEMLDTTEVELMSQELKQIDKDRLTNDASQ